MTDVPSNPSTSQPGQAPQPAPMPQPSAAPVPIARSYAYPFLAQTWWALGLRGAIAILFGLIAFLSPAATVLSLVLVFAAYVFVDGVLGLVAAFRAANRHERWGLLALEAVANILMAAVAVMLPAAAAFAFIILLAAWALITGLLMIGAGTRVDPEHGRWWLIGSGVVSALFGVLLMIAPLVSLVVVTWWLGAYAVVFGAGLLMLAFRLYGRVTAMP